MAIITDVTGSGRAWIITGIPSGQTPRSTPTGEDKDKPQPQEPVPKRTQAQSFR